MVVAKNNIGVAVKKSVVEVCRVCHGSDLTRFLDLGFTARADDLLPPHRLKEPEVYYPLDVLVCREFALERDSLVIDIGSNVGVLMQGLKSRV